MAYIHVKRIREKKYYTLRISVRENNKVVTKDLCNLGSDITKINLNTLEKEHKAEIRKSYKTIKKFLESNKYLEKVKKLKPKTSKYYNKEQLLNIEAIKFHFNTKFLKLDELTKKEYYENFLINFAVNSTSIEGNTIPLEEAGRLLKDDILPKNKTMTEVYDLINTKTAVNFLMDNKPKLSLQLIERIHDILLEKIDNRKGFRNHDIRIFGQPFKPSPARYVKADLNILLKWYEKNKKKLHPLVLATFFHHKFEKIHPFSDGNGRTGRTLMNYILFSLDYPPIIISHRFRREYLECMNKADKSLKKGLTNNDIKHYSNLLNFIYSEYKSSYWDLFLI
tara:strand:+ start:3450 stop:4460 length:1011 start_codon:yes stop_codon:yes gene_type:complete